MTSLAAEEIVQQAPDALILVGQDGDIAFANASVQTLFGYEPGELVGQRIEVLVPSRFRRMHQTFRGQYTALPVNREMGARVVALAAVRKDGSEFPVEIRLSPVDIKGQSFVVAAVRDVTERRRVTEELQAARAEADRANRSKSRFLAAASHDLRQPLQTLQLLTGALLQRSTDPATTEIAEKQQEALDLMTDLLNALLDTTKLESGTLTPVITAVPLAALFADLRRQFEELARTHGLALEMNTTDDVIQTDRVLLRQLLQNLLNNAIKYTPAGRISLTARRTSSCLELEVADTGVGIAADDLERIFDEYYRLKKPGVQAAGFGLGLTIGRGIARLLGFELRVTSREGVGSRFTVSIPLADAVEGPAASTTAPAIAAAFATGTELAILVVEDESAVRDALTLMLRNAGYEATSVGTADDALAVFASRGDTIDFVVTDLDLGGPVNGLGLLGQLREQAGRDLPALILSGDSSVDLATIPALPRLTVLRKPVDSRRLVETIEELFGAL